MSDVRHFGAVGDGETDDTEAIRHAIKEGDGSLYFPTGTYRIDETIEIPLGSPAPFVIHGESGVSCVRMHGKGPAFRMVGHHEGTGAPASWTPAVKDRERLPSIRHLVIEGRHAEADGLELEGVAQPILEGLLVRYLRHGIRLVRRNRNVIISHCHVYHNTGVGIFLDGVNLHQINLVGNHVSYNRRGGIRIERSEIRNLQITGNDIEYNNARSHPMLEDVPTAEIYVDTTAPGASVNEVTIASNTIQATSSPEGANIRVLEKPGTERHPGLWAITGNVIGSQEVNVHITGGYGITLSGNTIYSATRRNLLVEHSRFINVTGNHFRRHTPAFGTGVRFEDSTDCLFASCQIHDESEEGQESGASLLEIDSCARLLVNGCQFSNGCPFGIAVHDSRTVRISHCLISEERTPPRGSAVRFSGTGGAHALLSTAMQGDLEIADGISVQRESID